MSTLAPSRRINSGMKDLDKEDTLVKDNPDDYNELGLLKNQTLYLATDANMINQDLNQVIANELKKSTQTLRPSDQASAQFTRREEQLLSPKFNLNHQTSKNASFGVAGSRVFDRNKTDSSPTVVSGQAASLSNSRTQGR